jgi:hypothetical protein
MQSVRQIETVTEIVSRKLWPSLRPNLTAHDIQTFEIRKQRDTKATPGRGSYNIRQPFILLRLEPSSRETRGVRRRIMSRSSAGRSSV